MQIKNTSDYTQLHKKILVYGNSGSGKTTLCSTCPEKTLIISAESGLLSIKDKGIDYVDVNSIESISEVYKYLQSNADKGEYRWVCLDSLSEISEVVLAGEKGKTKDTRLAYIKMWERMESLIRVFRDLPRNVIMTCKIDKLKDESTGALSYSPGLPGAKFANNVPYFFDFCLSLRSINNKESGGAKRFLQCHPDNNYVCKDRSGKLDDYESPCIASLCQKVDGLK